jgi:hypothetical protein
MRVRSESFKGDFSCMNSASLEACVSGGVSPGEHVKVGTNWYEIV